MIYKKQTPTSFSEAVQAALNADHADEDNVFITEDDTLGFVPYSGASTGVNLGLNNFKANKITVGNEGSFSSGVNFWNAKALTGASDFSANFSNGEIQSDVLAGAIYYRSIASVQAAPFTLPILYHFQAFQSTFGAGSTVSLQVGFVAASNIIGGVINQGFNGGIPAGLNRWNLYMSGSAQNYINGNLGLGITVPTAKLHIGTGSITQAQLQLDLSPAPNTPISGQIWRENDSLTGLKIYQNGATRTITLT